MDRQPPAGAAGSLAVALAIVIATGCSSGDAEEGRGGSEAATTDPPWFEEVALESGIDFTHVRAKTVHFWFPEIMGSGLTFLDHDGDGDLDLYCIQSGQLGSADPVLTNRLFENDGGRFSDVTERAGVGDPGYGMGCATGDYDGDGDTDLYVTNVGPNVLYRNEGDGTFSDVTESARVGHAAWGTSSAFVDYDTDGDLDLFVVNNINWSEERELECASVYGTRDYCSPKNYKSPAPDVLYRNDGDGTFTDVSKAVGLDQAFGNGLGIACGDFNGDGRADVYVANDGTPNQLWINRGGTFVEQAMVTGCAVNMQGAEEAGMGVAAVDVDEDGDLDLFMTHLRDESNTFYFNKNGIFTDRTTHTGLLKTSIQYTGFGLGFADFDRDGVLDLYIANGRVGDWKPRFIESDPFAEPNQLFRGLGGGRFEEVSPQGGNREDTLGVGRGAAFGDYDNDGDVDVAVLNNDGRATLYRNIHEHSGHWLGLRVLGPSGSDALGAQVRVETTAGVQHRQVQASYSYCSASDPRVHVGLGAADAVDAVHVRWPDGSEEEFTLEGVDRYHTLRQGEGQ